MKNEFTAREELVINLERLSQNYGKTQADLCAETGISKSAMSAYFSGARYPRAEQLDALAKCFGVSVGVLLGNAVIDDERISDLPIELRIIAREGRRLSRAQLANLYKYCQFMYPDVFGDK